MIRNYFLLVFSALAVIFNGATSMASTVNCQDPGMHMVTRHLCCPEGKVLNKKNQCAYPTKNGCPSGFHPQPHNTCCPVHAVLTSDGYCTDMSYGGSGSSSSGGSSGGSTHPCFTSTSGPTASDAIGECGSLGGEVIGQSFNGSFWTANCQYGCQK